jgi:hypothetical protein
MPRNRKPRYLNTADLKFRNGEPMILVEESCWIWQGARDKDGYGRIWNGVFAEVAHRYFWRLKNGKVPRGMELNHTCRRRSCCNPDHVEAVTKEQNLSELFADVEFSSEQINSITEALLDDIPVGQIAYDLGVSKFAILKVSKLITQREQLTLTPEVPF